MSDNSGLTSDEIESKTIDGETKYMEYDPKTGTYADQQSFNNYQVLEDLRVQVAAIKTDIDQFHRYTKACLGTESSRAFHYLRAQSVLTSGEIDRNGNLDTKNANVVYVTATNADLTKIIDGSEDGQMVTVMNNQSKDIAIDTKANILLGNKITKVTLGRNDIITFMWHKGNSRWYKTAQVDHA